MNTTLNADSITLVDSASIQPADSLMAIAVVTPESAIEAVSQPGAWTPIWIPTICSIAVFVLGWILTRWFKNKDDRQSRADYRKMVLDWIDLITPIESEFVERLNKLSENIQHSDDLQPVSYEMPQGIPDRLNELPLEKVTEAFTKDECSDPESRNKHLFNIISGLEYCTKMTAEVVRNYETYNSQVYALCNEWNQVYISFVNSLNKCSLMKHYQPTINEWKTELLKKKDSPEVHYKYVEQLIGISDDLNDNYLMPYLNQMHVVLRQHYSLNVGFAKNFKNMAFYLNISQQSLLEAAAFFKANM